MRSGLSSVDVENVRIWPGLAEVCKIRLSLLQIRDSADATSCRAGFSSPDRIKSRVHGQRCFQSLSYEFVSLYSVYSIASRIMCHPHVRFLLFPHQSVGPHNAG